MSLPAESCHGRSPPPSLPPAYPRGRPCLVLLSGTVTLLFAALAFALSIRWEKERLRYEFSRTASDRASAIRRGFQSRVESLHAAATFFEVSRKVERNEFIAFAEGVLARHPDLISLEWVPAIPGSLREQHETEIRAEGFNDYEIVERDAEGRMVRAEPRAVHLPISYVAPFRHSNKAVFGFDYASCHQHIEVIWKARDSGLPAVTERTLLRRIGGSHDENKQGCLIFMPVYKTGAPRSTLEERRKNLSGFIVESFVFLRSLESLLAALEPEGADVFLHDDSAPPERRVLHQWRAELRTGTSVPAQDEEADAPEWRETFQVADRKWSVLLRASPEFTAVHESLTSWIVLACGLCGAVLVVSYCLRETLRIRRVDLLVAERTKDLADANAELRKLSRAVEQSPISILVTDKEGKIEYVNPRFTEVTGHTLDEARGKHAGMLSDQAVPTEEFRRCREAILSGGEWRGEIQSARKDGEPCWEALCISPITDPRGTLTNFIVLKTDVTERKRAESELQQAKETAEAATRLKSEFLANMSHEIRTPMGAVLGMAELLLNTSLDSEQREYVESIRTCSESLIGVIGDILDFSKMEAGKLELEREPLDVVEAVEECLDMVAPQAAEKGLELGCSFGAGTPATILGDVTRLRQILTNLLSNAVKFTDSGEILATVECPAAERQGAGKGGLLELHFTVKDTGVGISEDQQARLFKPFGQAEASTARRYGGTGLGLMIARRLSEIMGGTLWLESEERKGSTFHFTILAEPVANSQRSHLRGPQPQLVGKRVLVVDDNAMVRQATCSVVGSWGMFPSAVASGKEALDRLEQGEPLDLALLDVQMPDMDGLELAMEIRKRRGPDVLPLVMMTSVGLRGEKLKSARVNCQAVVTKPLRLGRLYEALMGVFGAQDAREAGASSRWAAIPRIAERHPLRVLLAEDNPMNQKLVLRLLEKMGYKADLARDGLQVLEALAERPYDVILMDVQMPELDGLEVTRRIRTALPEEARPRIVAMTAAALPADREACREAGMDDYLAKPLKVDDLVAVLATSIPRGSCRD